MDNPENENNGNPGPEIAPENNQSDIALLSSEKQKIYNACATAGISEKRAYEIAGYRGKTRSSIASLNNRIETKILSKPKYVRSALKAVQDTLDMAAVVCGGK